LHLRQVAQDHGGVRRLGPVDADGVLEALDRLNVVTIRLVHQS